MMRTFTNTDIIHALTVLQTTCREECSCAECPLGADSENCRCQLLKSVPSAYSINTLNAVWRALKPASSEKHTDTSHT